MTTATQIVPFELFEYQRPDIAQLSKAFEQLLEQFENAPDAETCSRIFANINQLRVSFSSAQSLCHVRHTINTHDKFYEGENDFFDQQMPVFQALDTRFYKALVASTYRSHLEEKWGAQLFTLADMSLQTFDPVIMEDLQEENRLSSEYTKLKAKAKVRFRKQTYNLSTINALEEDMDRETRRGASKAKWRFFEKHGAEFDRLFDELVQVRTRMAKKLGFDSFIELGYLRMNRSDYNAAMIQQFSLEVEKHIVPIATELYKRQAKRLGQKKLTFYDEVVKFKNGNPQPQGTPNDIIDHASSMYNAMSPQTAEFFSYMREANLMDLLAHDGKANGGYCTYINTYQSPFIFSNFNGTSGDIDVLTHEAGHAFQVYMSRNHGIVEYNWPTFEACEIHSMSMEFFAWPWMESFFGERADEYRFAHLASAIQFLPYGVAVDAFQHEVYRNPSMSPKDRNELWRSLEKRFLPHRDFAGLEWLEQGHFWQKQSHIYQSPFYYIDYVLAQFCAFQYWQWNQKDNTSAWNSYISLCKAGGSKSFLQLVADAGLRSPFEPGCVADMAEAVNKWLSK